MDAFKDRLSERAQDTSRPALAIQCQGRALTPEEDALASAMMEIFVDTHDFDDVAKKLTERGITAPKSGSKDWTRNLLASELAAINAELDAAYEVNGYGA